MGSILFILVGLAVLALLFIILKQYMNKIGNKDLNNYLLRKQNTEEKYYFFNEKLGKIYMINTFTGELYFCEDDNEVNQRNFTRKVADIKYNTDVQDYKKLCDNYYKIIKDDLTYDIANLNN